MQLREVLPDGDDGSPERRLPASALPTPASVGVRQTLLPDRDQAEGLLLLASRRRRGDGVCAFRDDVHLPIVAGVLAVRRRVGARAELGRARDEEDVEALHVVDGVHLLELDAGAVEEVDVPALDCTCGSVCQRDVGAPQELHVPL